MPVIGYQIKSRDCHGSRSTHAIGGSRAPVSVSILTSASGRSSIFTGRGSSPSFEPRVLSNADGTIHARFLHFVDARSAKNALIDRGANVSMVNTDKDGPFVVLGAIEGAPRVDVSGIGDSSALTSLQQLVVLGVANAQHDMS